MSTKLELMHHALNIAETAKDAMRTDSIPDDATWGIAVDVLRQAQEILPASTIVQNARLTSKLWVSMRSTMEAVANSLNEANRAELHSSLAKRNRRVLGSMRRGY